MSETLTPHPRPVPTASRGEGGRLAERVVIVTGGAKGIGRHYSHALADEGARVVIADIADGRELAEEIASAARHQLGHEHDHRRER